MKKLFFIVLFLSLLIIPVKSFALSSVGPEDDSGNAVLEADVTIDDNLAIGGNTVSVRGDVKGDLFAVGNIVNIEGNIEGNLFAAGNMVTVSGIVEGDVFLGGNNVTISENAQFNRDAFIGGNIVSIDGNITRNLFIGTSQLSLNSIIGGDTNAAIASINMGDNALIKGKLKYSNQQELKIADPSKIQGGIEFNQITSGSSTNSKDTFSRSFNIAGWFIGLLQLLFVGLILIAIMPKWIDDLSENIRKKFWSALGIGFLIMLIVPPALMILLISVIGLPISFALLGIYLVFIYLVKFWVAYCIGNFIKPQWSNYIKMLVGIIIIQILYSIPFIGFLTKSVVLLVGLGSLYMIKPFKNAK